MAARGRRRETTTDRKPVTRFVRTRLTEDEHRLLLTDAATRNTTVSNLTRAILHQHYYGTPLPAPRSHGPLHAALFQLSRIANNISQIEREKSHERLPFPRSRLAEARHRIGGLVKEPGTYTPGKDELAALHDIGRTLNSIAHLVNTPGATIPLEQLTTTMERLERILAGA